ncbi:MAG: EthD domain-containing protein [Proteobacteria bacterium]|nr:EthD domain-containing protein [Pseudomonadota bacterium]
MIKLTYCLHRLPHLTREEFQKYWLENHGPLVRSQAETIRLKKYVQVHTLLDPAINEEMRQQRGAPEPYDGVAELWWKNAEELALAYSTPEGQKVTELLFEDEKKFIDHSRSPLWFAEENTILDG